MADFNPQPGSWLRLGGAALGLVDTIQGKLNDAEAQVQYRNAYEMLRKGSIDFNNSLLTDPDHEHYLDKWNKQKDTLWNAATKMVTNQNALNALSDTWANLDTQQYGQVTGLQTRARIQDTYNRAASTEKSIMLDGTRSNDTRKQSIRDNWSPLVAAGIITQEQANQYYAADDKQIDLNAAESGVKNLAHSQGWDAALKVFDEPGFMQFFPSLDAQDKDALQRKMETQQLFEEGQAAKREAQQLAGIDNTLNTALGNFLEGKPGALNTDMIEAQDFPTTPTAQNKKTEWLRYYETMVRQKENQPMDPGVDLWANQVLADPNTSIAKKRELFMKAGTAGLIPKKYMPGLLTKSGETTFNPFWKSFLDEVAAKTQRPPDGSDPLLTKEQASTVMDDVRRLMQQNPDMSVDDLKAKGNELVKLETDKTLRKSVDALYSAVSQGEFRDWLDVPDLGSMVDSMNKGIVQQYQKDFGKATVSTLTDDNGMVIIDDGKNYWRAEIGHGGRLSWYNVPHGQEQDLSAWKLVPFQGKRFGGRVQDVLGGEPINMEIK